MHPNPLEIKPGRIFILRCVRKSEHTTLTGGILYTGNVHADYTTVCTHAQAETFETKGPAGGNPRGAYVISRTREEIRTPDQLCVRQPLYH